MREPRWACALQLLRWLAVAFALILGTTAQAVTQDITNQFTITRSGLALNRTTNTFDQTITLKNTSGGPVLAPIQVVVGISPSSVTLFTKAGFTPDGKPYVSPMAAGALLQSGGALSFVLKFANPSRVTFTSVLQVLYSFEVPPDAPSLLGVVATGGTSAYLVGRVEAAAPRDITVQATTASTCVLGSLVGGTNAGAPMPARTDGAGYFGVAVSGVSPGDFVSVKTTLPSASPSSSCLVSSRDNDSWPKAFLIDGAALPIRDFIDAPGKARWYKFAVTPGQRIEVKLTGLPADYDLAVFKDIGQVFASEFKPETAGTSDLLKLSAEYAPSVFSPSVFSPSVFSPSVFSPDAYAPSVFSPSVFSPSVFSPSVFSPSVFSPSVFSPSVFSPSVFSPSVFSPSVFSPSVFSPSVFSTMEVAQAFSTAQTRSIIAVSATLGLSDELAVVNTWNRTGHFYVRVSGRGGAFNTSIPFALNVTKGETSCAGVTNLALTARTPVAASGLKTVIVTDSSRVALDAPLPAPSGGTLRAKLAALAARSEVGGVVVDVANDDGVKALRQQAANNPACPFAKNLVAEEIKGIVDSYRANPLRYVVIAGNDDVVPFFRSPDQSAIGLESNYVPPVESNSPSEASLRRDFVLSQDKYGSKTTISLPWNDFPVPGLAVGRLVETATEIAGMIDAYIATDSVVSPSSSLVTGYDFLEDAAIAVKSELDAGTGAAGDALITPNGKSPQDPASWTADQLRTKLFRLPHAHDVIYLAGHFSANSALAADFKTSLLTTDLAASPTDFTNSIVFSAGCHAGYNLVDGDAIAGVTLPLDWAQAFARKRATLIAGTGYQYGDTDFLEYSERLYNNFARQLRAGSGEVPVGEALVKAKHAYLAATPDIRGLHEKALLESALFGLPMLAVNMPSGRTPVPGTSGAITPQPVLSGPAASLGLNTFDLNQTSVPALTLTPLTPHTIKLKNVKSGSEIDANYLSGPDGVVAKPGEPALPLAVIDVTPNVSGLVLRGIGYRGGAYADSGALTAFTGAPSTESRGAHVAFLSPVFYPTTLWTPNYFGALSGSGGTQLLVTPAQHRAASIADGTSTQRKHTGMSLRLFYSGNLSKAALSDAPSIVAFDTQRDNGDVTVAAQVVGDPAAAIHQVWVTYTGDGANTWASLDLDQCIRTGAANLLPAACGTTDDSRMWKGRIASPPVNPKFFVQAVNGVGLVARNDNFGAFFGIASLAPTATTLALVAPPSSATVGDAPAVTAKLTYSGGVGVGGKLVAVAVGGAAQLGTTASDGSVTVKVPMVAVPGTYQITAAFAGDDAFLPSSVSTPITIARAAATPTVLPATGGAPAGINIAGSLGGASTAMQQVPVAFTVNGPGGTTIVYSITDSFGNAIFPPPSGLPPGDYTVTQASFGGDGIYAPTTITFPTPQHVTVPKLGQSIGFDPAFAALVSKVFGDPAFAIGASASSGLPVALGASGACTLTGSTVHLTGGGTCTITADQGGNATYNPAPTAMHSFAVVTPPTVVSLKRAVPNPTMADSVTYTATFSEAVTGVTAGNFAVTTGGALTGASVGAISGGGTTWTVAVNTGRRTGSVRLDVVNGTGVTNGSGVSLAGLPFTDETYQIDKGGTVLGTGEGQLVTSFGYALFGDAQIPTTPGRVRVRSNGQILAAGGTGCAALVPSDPLSPFYCTLQLARYTASGVPDASFGTNGRVVTTVTNIGNEVNFSIDSDGSWIVRGIRYNGADDVPFVAKFTSAGLPDPSFVTPGVVTLNSLPLGLGILGSVVDTSGRTLIVGTTPDTGIGQRQDIFVTRLTPSGETDTTFGTNGVAQFAISNVDNRSDRGTTIDVQPDGMIIIGGRTKVTPGLGYDFLLMRLRPTGELDLSFNPPNGFVTTRFPASTGDNFGRRLVLQPDGKIALVGTVTVGATNQCGIARFNSNGTLDPGFGTGGQVLEPVSVGCFNANQQPDGKLVIAGNDRVGDVTYGTFIRLQLTGALDTSFGNGGFLDISNFDTPTRVAFTSSGNIVTGLTIQDPADGMLKSYVVELTTTLTGPWVAQTIAFAALPDRTYGDAFQVSATATSGLPVSFAANGNCVVSGDLVQVTGIGSCTITASQSGDATWLAATPVARTFSVTTAAQTIAFAPAPTGVTAGQLITISAASGSTTAPSTIPIAYSSQTPTVCTTGGINGSVVTLVNAGTCTIAANQTGDANYNAAAPATQSFTVDAPGTPPSTYTVTNLNDSGAGSLRDAIGQANNHAGPDTVNFQSGLTGTITLTSGQIQISGPLSIVGPGAGFITIDGNGVLNATPWSRIFSIFAVDLACPTLDAPADYLVSISGLRLVNGRNKNSDGSGGAIYTGHSLMLDSVVIENSVARSGGGVQFVIQYPGQALTVTDSIFLNNRATELVPPTLASNTAGGAIHVVERCSNAQDVPYTTPVSVNIANSEFRGNDSQPLTINGRGGALRSYSLADIVITDTIIVDNFVVAPNPPAPGKNYHGGGFDGTARSLRIERSEIAENSAYDVTGADVTRSGGLHLYKDAIDRQGPSDTMAVKIINSTISGNASTATAGAMLAFGNVALELVNTTVADNLAAPTRTGGIVVSQGATSPVSGSNTARPTLKLASSIAAGNSSAGGDIAASVNNFSNFTISAFNSMIETICPTPNCVLFVSGTGNVIAPPDPLLDILARNPDPPGTTRMRTHALLPGSPAIDTGSNPLALTTDQRGAGFPRVSGAAADMGAYELGAAAIGADVAITQQVSNATPTIGQNVTFNVVATNIGPEVVSGVTVQDLLPSGYAYVSHSATGTYSQTTGVWTVGTLGANQAAALNITAMVLATGSYTNTATKTASTPTDPNPANDSASVTTTPSTDAAPVVVSTSPAAGAAGVDQNANLQINFSEAVTVTGNWFQIVCSNSGTRNVANTTVTPFSGAVYGIDPSSDFLPGDACTVTVFAAQVSDQDLNDPPDRPAADFVFSFNVITDAAPVVVSTSPAAGAAGVDQNANLQINFSEAVTVTGNWFQIVCSNSGTRNVANTTVTPFSGAVYGIDPSNDFLPGDACTVTVFAAQVSDQDLNDPPDRPAADFVFSFNVITDAAPVVVSTSPAAGAAGVDQNANLQINFSEAVTVTGNWFQIVCSNSGTRNVANTTVTPFSGAVYGIDPSNDFLPGDACTVTVFAAQVSDQDLNDPPDRPAADFVFSFNVITDAAPVVVSTSPAAGAAGVDQNANLQINFSEAVTVTGNWFQIVCSNSGTRNVANTTVTPFSGAVYGIDPSSDFLPGDACTVTVFAAQVSDQDLNDPPDRPAADFVFSFNVITDAAPVVVSTSPAAGAAGVDQNANLQINFSEAVTVTGNWFQIVCSNSGTRNVANTTVTPFSGAVYGIDPSNDFLPGDACTVTVFAAQVSDQDLNDPPDRPAADFVFSFAVAS